MMFKTGIYADTSTYICDCCVSEWYTAGASNQLCSCGNWRFYQDLETERLYNFIGEHRG